MKPVLIVYATREGHTRRIAERIAGHLQRRTLPLVIHDLSNPQAWDTLDDDRYAAVIVVASVHDRRHEPEAIAFAKEHAPALNRVPCLVLSVSLAAMVARRGRSEFWRGLGALGARKLLDDFLKQTGLVPARKRIVAGALAYPEYGPIQRREFQAFAQFTGLPTDISRDHDGTDYMAVHAEVDALLAPMFEPPRIVI